MKHELKHETIVKLVDAIGDAIGEELKENAGLYLYEGCVSTFRTLILAAELNERDEFSIDILKDMLEDVEKKGPKGMMHE